MSYTQHSVEEELNKALAALTQACRRLKPNKKECDKSAAGSEDKGDSEQQL